MTILRTTLVALGVLFLAFAARAGEAKHEGFNELSVDEVADLIAKRDIDIFDNNAYDDWKAGHVPTAKWVSFKDVKEADLPKDRSRKVVFYCHDRK
ncbi:MAG: rhodanese-like domain-containing protein [Deltaproteobacteria bacterium]|nr:MAG: rhodanese-like domain-containing protein [Deltaproteobacteria bacterium]